MQVFLIGGGWDDDRAAAVHGGFLAAARQHAGGDVPRVLLVVLGTDAEAHEYHERYVAALALAGEHELDIERIPDGGTFDAARLEGANGLFVGGGATPEYHAALSPAFGAIRDAVGAGLPYAGFSAGAAVAATDAVIGGWRIDGVAVCPEESNEDLDAVAVVPGLGLVEGAVDVHAAAWGNLSRLVAVVDRGLAPHGVAIDECTTLHPDGTLRGAGAVWRVERAEDGVVVRRTGQA
jgi:cyanophycinase